MSGAGVPVPPPPPPVDPATTAPPNHEVVIDAQDQHSSAHITVDLDSDNPVVIVGGSHRGGIPIPPPRVDEPVVNRTDETSE